VAVIGTGMMGPGIALTLALAGHRVMLYGRSSDSLARGLTAVDRGLQQLRGERQRSLPGSSARCWSTCADARPLKRARPFGADARPLKRARPFGADARPLKRDSISGVTRGPTPAPVAVIGTGMMGPGIALTLALAGHPVMLYGRSSDSLTRGLTTV